jgi:heme/copper-type cytochrome/quinol oxidase subunit 2
MEGKQMIQLSGYDAWIMLCEFYIIGIVLGLLFGLAFKIKSSKQNEKNNE